MIDVVSRMAALGEYFLAQARAFDERVTSAIDADASQPAIEALMNLSATNRLRALSCYQACAPYLAPKLAAVEIGPQSPTTISKFERAISNMTEQQVVERLRLIAGGAQALEVIEADSADND